MLQAKFHVSGIVQELRELKSEKNKSWRGYRVKVATLGLTMELTVTHDQHSKLAAGEMMEFAGLFEQAGQNIQYVVHSFKPFKMTDGKAA